MGPSKESRKEKDSIEALDERNYRDWAFRVKLLLKKKEQKLFLKNRQRKV